MRFSLPAAALALAAAPLSAALPVGAAAPDIQTQASLAGNAMPFSLKAALKKGPVVLYFYPAAFTPGCTIEAHDFAEATDDFQKMGATVIGMSADPIEKLNKFSVTECRNKFAVGSATAATIKAYDVAFPVKPELSNRTSFVIAPNGKVIYVYSALDPAGHVKGTMDAVKPSGPGAAGGRQQLSPNTPPKNKRGGGCPPPLLSFQALRRLTPRR